ncbi:MFS transporter [Noviherbaspirillum denitrificans]|uniref:Major facilitator superfamily (MFS) profile domain-containing protein n=1 Tax=Noviherbaspirillum denitrificans TaxID=1968433 RepID=A0A254TDE4_9BURK|nr:MFS transporter [Noviherbaspirillum denitrificans]OWW20187.1 hypothetical protein AYR66_12455 [Noviherbaspirillum denitrificans]
MMNARAVPLWLVLTLLFGIQPVATDLYLPALPEIAASFGGQVDAVQWTLTVYVLAFGLTQLFIGTLADRYGRRKVMLTALALYVLASIVPALVNSLGILILCRALQGVATASCAVSARAVIRDRYCEGAGMRVMAQSMTGMSAAALMSPVIGGLSTSVMGWQGTLSLVGAIGAAIWLIVYFGFPDTHAPAASGAQAGFGVFLRRGQFVFSSLLAGASFSGAISFLLLSSFIFIGEYGMSRFHYGLVVAACSLCFMLGTLACRRYLSHATVPQAIRAGAALTVTGGASQLLLWLAGVREPWALIVPQCIYMLGHGFHQPCGQAGAVAPFPQAAGRAASTSGFLLTAVAFTTGQCAAASPLPPAQTLVTVVSLMSAFIAFNAWFAIPRAYRARAVPA